MIWKICEFSFIIVQQVSLHNLIGPRRIVRSRKNLLASPWSPNCSEQQVCLYLLNNERFCRPVRRTCPLLFRSFGCFVVTTEMYRPFSFFACQISSFLSTGSTEYGTSTTFHAFTEKMTEQYDFTISWNNSRQSSMVHRNGQLTMG